MRVEKWQSLGNDYLVCEEEALPWALTEARVRLLCDPHFGLGSDGILLLTPPESDQAVAGLRIFNPDGSEAELSGNGARQAALYLRAVGKATADTFLIETNAGDVSPTVLANGEVRMAMGTARTMSPEHFPDGPENGKGEISAAGRRWDFSFHAIGNPQCALRVEEGLEDLDLSEIGPAVECHQEFPQRTNVSFWRLEPPTDGVSTVRARIFERGVGETLASGTGACGAALAAVGEGTESPVLVRLDGGELTVEVDADLGVTLTGWGERVYAAELSESLLTDLANEKVPPSLSSHP